MPGATQLHGSAVAVGDRGLLILGAAGSGKSTLAAGMIALGAELIADDRVVLTPSDGRLELAAPERIAGLIELRGFGLVRLAARGGVALSLIADLDEAEPERLPPRRWRPLFGVRCPVMLCRDRPALASVLTCILRAADWPDPEMLPPV